MKIENVGVESASIAFSKEELLLFIKSAKVILDDFSDGEFHTRTGYVRGEAEKVMNDLAEVIRTLDEYDHPRHID